VGRDGLATRRDDRWGHFASGRPAEARVDSAKGTGAGVADYRGPPMQISRGQSVRRTRTRRGLGYMMTAAKAGRISLCGPVRLEFSFSFILFEFPFTNLNLVFNF
jgi:hypothetical protein